MLLRPIPKGRAWGGSAFVHHGKFAAPDSGALPIGESWELADLPAQGGDACSTIESGPFAGRSLREALHSDARRILGRCPPSPLGRFPLLVKFLDAAQNLSVQVHPSAAYAAAHPGAHLKTETWFVLEAVPGARIWRGLRHGITREDLAHALREGRDIVPMLESIPARPGDCIEMPSGLVHALGAGITVAEIQTPSDTTFRVFDWNRDDPTRALHVEQALECMAFGAAQGLASIPPLHAAEAPAILTRQFRTTHLSRTPHYRIERLEALEAASLPIVTHERPSCWMVLAGSVSIEAETSIEAGPWRTLLVPSAAEGVVARLSKGAVILRANLPDPMERWLA